MTIKSLEKTIPQLKELCQMEDVFWINPNKETVKLFLVKLDSYETIEIPSPIQDEVKKISESYDRTENDLIDTSLLNEVFVGRVDILITEDKKIHKK